MLTKEQKAKLVLKIAEILKSSENILFSDFTGLNMSEITALKRELKERAIGYKVVKKSLLKFAFEKAGAKSFDFSAHRGSVAISYNSGDPAVMAKILDTFGKVHQKLLILGGILAGGVFLRPAVAALARLAPREVLLAQLGGVLSAPATGLVRVLNANLGNLLSVLGKIKS